jgi:aldehyde dehydrogenase (NAD+)
LVRLVQLAIEAGLPNGLVAVLSGLGTETGQALVRHPDVSYVSFTGSTAAGARVMADAALTGCKPVTLELGGKSPQLVFGDVDDLDQVADVVAGGCMRNAGQVCFSGSRLVVHRSLAFELIDRIKGRLAEVRHGPTWEVDTTQGPIMSELQARRIEEILQRARAAGADLLCGGSRAAVEHGGVYFEPTLLLAHSSKNPGVAEEFFGPVLTVQVFEEEEEGLTLANHEVFGLAAGVHTRDFGRALRAARAIDCGTVWVNHYGPTRDYNAPFFSPHRQSGLGQEGGVPGLMKYLKSKAIRLRHG